MENITSFYFYGVTASLLALCLLFIVIFILEKRIEIKKGEESVIITGVFFTLVTSWLGVVLLGVSIVGVLACKELKIEICSKGE